jgi:predicted transcriptional regulator
MRTKGEHASGKTRLIPERTFPYNKNTKTYVRINGVGNVLCDVERKLLRILINKYRYEWQKPRLNELSRYAQRDTKTVKKALLRLIDNGDVEQKDGWIRVVPEWKRT